MRGRIIWIVLNLRIPSTNISLIPLLLNTDIHIYGTRAISRQDWSSALCVLQLSSYRDASLPRRSSPTPTRPLVPTSTSVLLLVLTDGVETIRATVLQPTAKLCRSLRPGCKVRIRGKCEQSGSLLVLEEGQIEVMGVGKK